MLCRLESHARYDEALGLYNLHETHLPNERLLAGLAALRCEHHVLLLRLFTLKMIDAPRQARDKHREKHL